MDVKYETPQVLIVEVEVEKGFVLSIGVSYERANDEYDIM
jgi:hypothetical protein